MSGILPIQVLGAVFIIGGLMWGWGMILVWKNDY